MKIAHGTLIMAVDGSKMLILRNEGDVRKPVLKAVAHERVHNLQTAEQGSDRPGRSFSSSDGRRSGLGETDWHTQAEGRFVIEAAQTLDTVQKDLAAEVILVAAPTVMGTMRKHLSERVKDHILAQIDRDVVNQPSDEIAKLVSAYEP